MLGDTRRLRLDEAGARERASPSSPACSASRSTPTPRPVDLAPRPPAAGRDHQGALARLARADPRRADVDADARRASPSWRRCSTRLKEQGQAVIFITHKLHEALALGDRVSILARAGSSGAIDREDARASSTTTSCGPRSCGSCSARRRAASADVAELQERAVEARGASRRALPDGDRARARERRARRRGAASSASRTSRSSCGRARSSASPASTGTASARWPR